MEACSVGTNDKKLKLRPVFEQWETGGSTNDKKLKHMGLNKKERNTMYNDKKLKRNAIHVQHARIRVLTTRNWNRGPMNEKFMMNVCTNDKKLKH